MINETPQWFRLIRGKCGKMKWKDSFTNWICRQMRVRNGKTFTTKWITKSLQFEQFGLFPVTRKEWTFTKYTKLNIVTVNTAKFLTETDLNSHVVIFIARCGRDENINKFNCVTPQSGHRYNRYNNKRNTQNKWWDSPIMKWSEINL